MPKRCRAGTAEFTASLFQLQRWHFGLSGCLVLPTHTLQPRRRFLLALSLAIASLPPKSKSASKCHHAESQGELKGGQRKVRSHFVDL